MRRIVFALGGNAILKANQVGTAEEQRANLQGTCAQIVEAICEGHDVLITHGNGPQVGNILLQNEEAFRSAGIPPMPLDICGAESQGMIGYMIQRALANQLKHRGVQKTVMSIVTEVLVDEHDPAFSNPTKPIGPFYTGPLAEKLVRTRGYVMREDVKGWRRVVPSPDPQAIVQASAIKELFQRGYVVIASGGGGIPVIKSADGSLVGIEAVIDKDLAAEVIAREVGADTFLILTDVDKVYLHYKSPEQVPLHTVTADEMEAWQREGHFRVGSMAPKVEAAIRFVRSGGERAIIASLDHALEALRGGGSHVIGSRSVRVA